MKDMNRTATIIVMLNDWTNVEKLRIVLKENGIKSFIVNKEYDTTLVHIVEAESTLFEGVEIKAVYNKETNETVITIVCECSAGVDDD